MSDVHIAIGAVATANDPTTEQFEAALKKAKEMLARYEPPLPRSQYDYALCCLMEFWNDGQKLANERLKSFRQAVLDPENQPSQFGTVLFSKDIPGSKPPS